MKESRGFQGSFRDVPRRFRFASGELQRVFEVVSRGFMLQRFSRGSKDISVDFQGFSAGFQKASVGFTGFSEAREFLSVSCGFKEYLLQDLKSGDFKTYQGCLTVFQKDFKSFQIIFLGLKGFVAFRRPSK